MEGLSIDFQMLNLLGFACYSAYNVALYAIPAVQHEYTTAYSHNIPLGLEDVAFSVHAAIISLATLVQCVVYERGGQRFLSPIGIIVVVTGALVLASFPVIAIAEGSRTPHNSLTWLNLLMVLSLVKLAVSLVKYIPQVRFPPASLMSTTIK